jgi:predicted RNA-binding Zn-ribbon protein involved in translation (DUF1610 family)
MTSPAVTKKYKFTFLCKTTKELEHVDNTTAGFTCPGCGLALIWIDAERRLGASGRDERTIGHEMRVAQEI